MSDVQDRLNNTLSRVDQVLAEETRRRIEALQREDAEQARADAMQTKADALKRVEIAEKYDVAFRSFGERCPRPAADERPGAYRKRMFEALRNKLPSTNEWSGVRADDIPASARSQIEGFVIRAAMAEGLRPSQENLPSDGSLLRRERTDDMGTRNIEWLGRESFLKQMGRPLQIVARIADPRRGIVHWGEQFERMR